MNKLITSISEMYVDDDEILRIKIIEGVTITLENIKRNFDAYKELLGEKRALLLIDGRVNYKFTREARIYAASDQMELKRVAVAFLVNSLMSKWGVTIFIRFNKPVVPTKMFSSEEKAIKWLKSFYVMPGEKYFKNKKK